MAKFHSFDVFNTALIRRVAVPSDIFRLVGKLIAQEMKPASHKEFVEHFLTARLQAEQKSLSQREETTLDEIWAALREMLPDVLPACGPDYELDVERKALAPNAVIAMRIARLRSDGARILFISDTYLPEDFVRAELLRHQLATDNDGIYVSSAVRLTKRTGALFEHVLRKEGIAPRDMHHYGDNLISDVRIPKRLGIGTTLLSQSDLNVWERKLLSRRAVRPDVTSSLAGSMRSFRLGVSIHPGGGSHELVSTFLGPIMLVWAAWVLAAARRDGIRRLYFVARDGHLVWRAARVLAPKFGDIECRYLKISRRTVLLPSTNEISPTGMPWLQRPLEPARLEALTQKLGLNWPDVEYAFLSLARESSGSTVLAADADWRKFWKIIQSPPIVGLVQDQIELKRRSILTYLRAEGLCESDPSALVDVGWHLMVQAGLQRLLGWPDRSPGMSGYYLGLFGNRMAPAVAGKAAALFYQEAPDYQAISGSYEIFLRINILEHLFGLASHGTVSDHQNTGATIEPICPLVSSAHAGAVDKVRQAIEEFCYTCRDDVLMYSEDTTARELIDSLLESWCGGPDRAALEMLEQVSVSGDSNNLDVRPLVEPWTLREAAMGLLPERLRLALKMTIWKPLWPEAALCRTEGLSAGLVRFRQKIRSVLHRTPL